MNNKSTLECIKKSEALAANNPKAFRALHEAIKRDLIQSNVLAVSAHLKHLQKVNDQPFLWADTDKAKQYSGAIAEATFSKYAKRAHQDLKRGLKDGDCVAVMAASLVLIKAFSPTPNMNENQKETLHHAQALMNSVMMEAAVANVHKESELHQGSPLSFHLTDESLIKMQFNSQLANLIENNPDLSPTELLRNQYDGATDGSEMGNDDGLNDGQPDGAPDGYADGSPEGRPDGQPEGLQDGDPDEDSEDKYTPGPY